MTDEVKKQVKAEIDEAAKQQADTILQVYCQVYDKLPANLSEDEMISLLYERITAHPERTIEQLLIGMLHKRVIMPVLKAAHIESIHRLLEQLEYDENKWYDVKLRTSSWYAFDTYSFYNSAGIPRT